MKNTVKILAVAVLFAISYQSFAQTFGIKAGLNLTNMTMKDDDGTYSDDHIMRLGLYAGGMVDVPLVNSLTLQPGLFLSQKGYKYDKNDIKSNTSLLYLEVPVTANYRFDAGKAKIYTEAGPLLGVGLSGKWKYEEDGEEESVSIKFGSEEDFKLLDIGLRIGGGVEIGSVQIGLHYDLGLSSISHDDSGGFKMTNKVFGVTLGYWFGGSK